MTLNRLMTFDFEFCTCAGRDHSLPGIESQGHTSRSWFRFKVKDRVRIGSGLARQSNR